MPIPAPKKFSGPYLYKFGSITDEAQIEQRLKPIIVDHELYVPSSFQLNDQADCCPYLALMPEEELAEFVYQQLKRREPTLSEEQLAFHKEVIFFNAKRFGSAVLLPSIVDALDKNLKGWRVYSMTQRYDMPNMWALYADNFAGYCLEFVNVGPLFEHANAVQYLDRAEMELKPTDEALLNGYFLFCKTPEWAGEQEVRLITPSALTPKLKLDPRWLVRIILGEKMDPAHAKAIRRLAAARTPELWVSEAFFDRKSRTIQLRT
jgi:hypothetical protein